MCTVTIIKAIDGGALPPSPLGRTDGFLRVACNRDESRGRPAALPPQRKRYGAQRALLPIDPVSGGTWIAVTDAGLGFVVLNVNRGPLSANRQPSKSRGLVIPALLSCTTLDQAIECAVRQRAADFAPFRLILLERDETAEVASTGEHIELCARGPISEPLFFTSSGLGDSLVESPRRELFRELLHHAGATSRRQDALHRHQWPDREHLSISMSRADARTVSFTTLEIHESRVVLNYHGGAPHEPAIATSLSLSCPALEVV